MDLLAAIDLMDGGAVRLVQGEFTRARAFGDPLAVAHRFLAAGAPWLHVVDLDAARGGEPVHRAAVVALCDAAHAAGARIEVGGGLRSARDVAEILAAGVDRAVLGTAAIETPGLGVRCARRHPGRVAVGLDYRRGADGRLEPAVRGWTGAADRDVGSLLEAFADEPFDALIVTAIARDGTLEGPDLVGLEAVLDATDLAVIASGGVGSADDLAALAALRSPERGRALAGAVVGRALVDGTIGVEEAVAACAASG
jgi:phosphoribosylformimino-5-aminoimidazole carboxamide ribotide isomerase